MTGVVYVHTATEVHPLGGVTVRIQGLRDTKTSVTLDVVSDVTGRYEAPGLVREYVLVMAAPQTAYLAPCAQRRWLRNDAPLDIHVVPREVLLATGMPASVPADHAYWLSGIVSENINGVVRPAAGVSVEHFYGDSSWDPDVFKQDPTGATLTNSEGRYRVCAYSDDYGQEMRVRKDGYRTVSRQITWLLVENFELSRD